MEEECSVLELKTSRRRGGGEEERRRERKKQQMRGEKEEALVFKNDNAAVSDYDIDLKKNYNVANYVATLKLILRHKREESRLSK